MRGGCGSEGRTGASRAVAPGLTARLGTPRSPTRSLWRPELGLESEARFVLEVYFPTEDGKDVLTDEDKEAFMRRMTPEILPLLKATNVVDVSPR